MSRIFVNRQALFRRQGPVILLAAAILIGVSLAAVRSTRQNEIPAIDDASLAMQIAQYPAGLQTIVVRMLINKSATVDELYFNPAADAGAGRAIDDRNPVLRQRAVFAADGGGAVDQPAPAAAMADGNPGLWFYNADFQVPNIGTTSTADNGGNDMIAFLPGVREDICRKIDEQLSLHNVPVLAKALPDIRGQAGIEDTQVYKNGAGTFPAPSSAGKMLGAAGELSGQPFACFRNGSDGPFVYYHVLIER